MTFDQLKAALDAALTIAENLTAGHKTLNAGVKFLRWVVDNELQYVWDRFHKAGMKLQA